MREEISRPDYVLYVGCAGLVVNCLGLLMFHEHGHAHSHSHEHRHEHAPSEAVSATPHAAKDDAKSIDSQDLMPQFPASLEAARIKHVAK